MAEKSRSTHKAVALAYRPSEKDDAPKVVAKGEGYVAKMILEHAEQFSVPIIPNPELSDMLSLIELGEEIPTESFLAVAEILRYVYALKGRMPPL